MPRIFAILLMLVLASPTAAWGGSLLPEGIDFLGAVPCCGSEERVDEPSASAQLERPCCCFAPTEQAPSVDNLYSVLSEEQAQLAPIVADAEVRRFVAAWPRVEVATSLARGPPAASGPLLLQHTSHLI